MRAKSRTRESDSLRRSCVNNAEGETRLACVLRLFWSLARIVGRRRCIARLFFHPSDDQSLRTRVCRMQGGHYRSEITTLHGPRSRLVPRAGRFPNGRAFSGNQRAAVSHKKSSAAGAGVQAPAGCGQSPRLCCCCCLSCSGRAKGVWGAVHELRGPAVASTPPPTNKAGPHHTALNGGATRGAALRCIAGSSIYPSARGADAQKSVGGLRLLFIYGPFEGAGAGAESPCNSAVPKGSRYRSAFVAPF
jgi:hypothetical protein